MISIRKGTIIAGKYRIEEPLARGGMGSIWVARHIQLDVLVAVKFIDPDFAATAEGRLRFEREARSAAMLHSPHVVQIHDYGVEYETPYLAMELLQGEDLSTRLKREGRLSMAESAKVAIHVSKALRRAHDAGIIHRDLKPSNIFIVHGNDEDEELIKVLDFGVAKRLSLGSTNEDETKGGSLIGSPRYMSPEQARRNREIDHRSDLWSLGVILFRAVTGQLPFPGDEIGDVIVKICSDPVPIASELSPDLAPEVDRFFIKALARDPVDRFQTARELASEFAVLAGALPPSSHFTWPLPGDGMRISWLPSITSEHTAPGGAGVGPNSNPTPQSGPMMKGSSTPQPAAMVSPGSSTLPSAEPLAEDRESQEPLSQTIPLDTEDLLPDHGEPLSSDPTHLFPGHHPPEEQQDWEADERSSFNEARSPIDEGRRPSRPTPPTLIIEPPPENTRRSAPSINDVVHRGPPSSDRSAYRGPPSSDKGGGSGGSSQSPSATLTGSNGTVDITTGGFRIGSRRPVALWVAVAGAVVIVGGAIAIVRLSLNQSRAVPASPIRIPLPPIVRETSARPTAAPSRPPRAPVATSAASTLASSVVSVPPSPTFRAPRAPLGKPDGGGKVEDLK
jgi:serine/threonine protein kinase